MEILRNWASTTRWKAMLLIVTGDILLIILGLGIGMSLYWKGLECSSNWMLLLTWVSLIVIYLFPSKKEGGTGMLRRSCHFAIYAIAFLLFISTGNKIPRVLNQASVQEAAMPIFTTNEKRIKKIQPKPTIKLNQSPTGSIMIGSGQPLKDGLKVAVEKLQVKNETLPSGRAWGLLFIGGITAFSIIWLLAQLSSGPHCSQIELAASLVSIVAVGSMAGAAVLLVMGVKVLAEQ